MRHTRLLATVLAACAALALSAQTPPPQPPTTPPVSQQPGEIATTIVGGSPGVPARLAVPEFVALSKDPETVKAAKTIGRVLFDDIAYEKEFYMIPQDIMRTVPQPSSADDVQVNRWKEVGADGVIIGTVQRSGEAFTVEVRLIQVGSGRMALGKKYTGTLESVKKDGGRVFAHTFADEVHKQQRGVRGIARTKLAFSSDRTGERFKGPAGGREIKNIYIADYDGANEQRVTANRTIEIAPVWAPDARAIAYTSYARGYPDIFVSFIYEGRLQAPAKGSTDSRNYLPAWSHNGERIAFMSAKNDGNTEIYTMNRDGSDVRRVTNHPMADSTPTWSPTGTQLAFTSDRSGGPQIYIVNVDGTGLERISRESFCDRPTWSPAPFNEIAYTCRGGGGYQIMLFDFATRSSTPISDGIGSNESPAFAPNGRHLAFVSDRTGRQQVYTMHRDGSGLRQITRAGANNYPNWSQ